MKFDVNNLNPTNYFHFDEGNITYCIIYPIDLRGVQMLSEVQLETLRQYREKDEATCLWTPERMYNFITSDLADQIISRLSKGQSIQLVFSKQADSDANEAYSRFNEAVKNRRN